MREGAEVLERDPSGDKVLRLKDGTILKLFRCGRRPPRAGGRNRDIALLKFLVSSAVLYPYARRFEANARALARIGVPVPEVIATFRIKGLQRDAVHYRPLPGRTLRELDQGGLSSEEKSLLKDKLTRLIIHLHDKGIYFRSLHIGNVVRTPTGELGLIDFSDLRRYPWALGKYLRSRNLQRMAGIARERDWLDFDAIVKHRRPGVKN